MINMKFWIVAHWLLVCRGRGQGDTERKRAVRNTLDLNFIGEFGEGCLFICLLSTIIYICDYMCAYVCI